MEIGGVVNVVRGDVSFIYALQGRSLRAEGDLMGFANDWSEFSPSCPFRVQFFAFQFSLCCVGCVVALLSEV